MHQAPASSDRQKAAPTVRRRRWEFFCRRRGQAAALLLPVLLLLAAGCGGLKRPPAATRTGADYAALNDSLGIDAFLALAEDVRADRRHRAERLGDESRRTGRVEVGIAGLVKAAGLAPDDPEYWLELAGTYRWVGDYLLTSQSLDNAAAAVRALADADADLAGRGKAYRNDAALRTALSRAWLHYDRAEFTDGLKWARTARQIDEGNREVKRVQGLLLALLGYRSAALKIINDLDRGLEFTTDIGWIHSNMEKARERYRESFGHVVNLRPLEDRSAECWRDMGRAAERESEWSYAQKWYRESAASLPVENTAGLREVTHPRLAPGPRSSHQPFWLAFGRNYVTGSLSAYTAYVFAQFDRAADPDDREIWGSMVVDAAGICIRLGDERPWAMRARGLVFAASGLADRALSDLGHAARELESLGIEDARIQAAVGRLWLEREDARNALGPLHRAVVLDATVAEVWSDYGLALIMVGDSRGAEDALTRAVAIDPGLTTAWYNRGLMYFHAGRMKEAEADLVVAARLAPRNEEIGQLLQEVHKRNAALGGE